MLCCTSPKHFAGSTIPTKACFSNSSIVSTLISQKIAWNDDDAKSLTVMSALQTRSSEILHTRKFAQALLHFIIHLLPLCRPSHSLVASRLHCYTCTTTTRSRRNHCIQRLGRKVVPDFIIRRRLFIHWRYPLFRCGCLSWLGER